MPERAPAERIAYRGGDARGVQCEVVSTRFVRPGPLGRGAEREIMQKLAPSRSYSMFWILVISSI